jgi:hypothetical protein
MLQRTKRIMIEDPAQVVSVKGCTQVPTSGWSNRLNAKSRANCFVPSRFQAQTAGAAAAVVTRDAVLLLAENQFGRLQRKINACSMTASKNWKTDDWFGADGLQFCIIP